MTPTRPAVLAAYTAVATFVMGVAVVTVVGVVVIDRPSARAALFPAMYLTQVLPAVLVFRRARKAFAEDRERLVKSGLCPACGYDLRATPGRCPECGTARGDGPQPGPAARR
jgi:predicted Zn-ribbon and HTH transcriptional regulator